MERSIQGDFARFLVSGGTAAAVHWFVLWVCISVFDWEGTVSTSVGFVVAATISYLLSYHWTFGSSAPHLYALPRFLAVAVTGMGLNAAIFAAMLYGLAVHYLVAQAVATGAVMFWNFFLQRAWSFRSPVTARGEPARR